MIHRRRFLAGIAMSAACAPSWSRALAAPSIRRFPASDGMLSADARREFVLGLYQLPRRDGAMREARGARRGRPGSTC
ncbi:MAG: hypothetical protein DVB31_03370 [Verrucomicrobia bacterium]|nr:MAG: hypothetical protein DVB31_03370 [Verrucomicrobiota bacterium]